MMGAVTVGGVLRAEHEVINQAFCDWIGSDKERAMEDIEYLRGIHDLACRIIAQLEGDIHG